MSSHTNQFVSFLRHYGPIPASDNMYDELIQAEVEKYDIKPPINIKPEKLDVVQSAIDSDNPRNVILTGTAGDGKTYYCRRVWENLGGSNDPWLSGDKQFSMPIPSSSHTLKIVKDLSELTQDQKDELMPGLARSISDGVSDAVYLVAANDGQLLSTWRNWSNRQGENERQDFKIIENMIIEGLSEDNRLSLDLHNLSQLDASKHFKLLASVILNHERWSGCKGCELMRSDGSSKCPIRINRDRMLGNDDDERFLSRILELLKLARSNSIHIPIRDLLLLCVNILLGDQKRGRNALLNCSSAKKRARKSEYHLTNPYANVFGANLKSRQRQQYQVFKMLETFGIGRETDNAFDNLLVYSMYENENLMIKQDFERLVSNDDIFYSHFRKLVNVYLESERKEVDVFMSALSQQRQRLFFSLPEHEPYNKWNLSVFQSAGKFLNAVSLLMKSEEFPDATRATLIKGLNRVFCGIMLDDTTSLLFASSGGDGGGRIAKTLNYKVHGSKHQFYPYVIFTLNNNASSLELQIIKPLGNPEDNILIDSIQIHLTHFEYICRVANGSLPASLSRQCHEDFLDFKLRAIKNLEEAYPIISDQNSNVVSLLWLSVNEQGQAREDEIKIKLQQ